MTFARENIDMKLVKLNDSLRSKLKNHYQPFIITQISSNRFLEMMYTSNDIDFKKSIIPVLLGKSSLLG